MMTSSGSFKSRMNRRKQVELEESRRAGLVAAEVDESLKHQRTQKSGTININSRYDRGAKILHADMFRKGAS